MATINIEENSSKKLIQAIEYPNHKIGSQLNADGLQADREIEETPNRDVIVDLGWLSGQMSPIVSS